MTSSINAFFYSMSKRTSDSITKPTDDCSVNTYENTSVNQHTGYNWLYKHMPHYYHDINVGLDMFKAMSLNMLVVPLSWLLPCT